MPDNPQAPRSSITESPWYWVYLFCTAGLIALMLMGPKFGARQAQIEREYQGRQRADQRRVGQEPSTPMSTSGETTIRLWPLYLILSSLLVVAWAVLGWRHIRRRSAISKKQGTKRHHERHDH